MELKQVKVGQLVCLLKDIGKPLNDSGPALLYAHKGEIVVVRRLTKNPKYPIFVSYENILGNDFGVTPTEISLEKETDEVQ